MTSVVLFTRDLRVADHPALAGACVDAEQVVPLFVLDPALLDRSLNRSRFLLECLHDLDASLTRLGGRLIIREGDVASEALRTAVETGATDIHLSGDVSAFARRRQERLAAACASNGIALHLHLGAGVVAPGIVVPIGKPAYKVFTPYHRAWLAAADTLLAPTPRVIRLPEGINPGRLPAAASIAAESPDLPRGGEKVGRRRLHRFLSSELASYGDARDRVDLEGTARLSPYLRFGCVSPRELFARAYDLPGAEPFLRQLAWRDFFRQQAAAEDRATADTQCPEDKLDLLDAWQRGVTGVPFVDAGMRQLRREGWMHNRARLVTSSFLHRRLGVPWQEGAQYFDRLLVDGDPAVNLGNWRWSAETTDPRRALPLNPIRQAHRYDPEGNYVRRYVEELKDVDTRRIFEPWKATGPLKRTGYPAPIIDLEA